VIKAYRIMITTPSTEIHMTHWCFRQCVRLWPYLAMKLKSCCAVAAAIALINDFLFYKLHNL